jgi:PAS domain S-box-containing protein
MIENDIKDAGREDLVLAQDIIYEINLESVIVSWNAGAETLYGWTNREAVGKSAFDVFRTEFHLKMYDFITETVKNYIWTGELSQCKHDGSKVTVSSHAILRRGEDGKPCGIIFVNRDITELKKTAEAFRESQELISITLRSIGDGVLTTDTKGHITMLNPVAEALTGWTMEEAMGQPVERIFNIINHETRNPSAIPVMETLEHGTIKGLANHTVLISRSGNEYDIADSCAPIRNNAGEVVGAVLVFRDVSERMQNDLALEKTRKELAITAIAEQEALEYAESLINTIRKPLLALDKDLRIVTANHSFYEFFKVDREHTIGQHIYDLGNKQWDIPKLRELLEDILPQKTEFIDYEVEHIFDNIGRRIMLLNARQIKRVLGKERIILLAIEDITARREIEEGLKKTHQELQDATLTLQLSEEKFDVTINSIGDGVMATDINGCITLLNPVAEELTGWTLAEAAGLPVDRIFNIIHHDTRKPSVIPVMETLSKGIIRGLANHTVLISRKGGEHDIADSCAPIRNRDGKVIGAVLVFSDVTERMAKEAALEKTRKDLELVRESEEEALEYAESLIDTIREPMLALDQDLRIVTASRSFYDFFKVKPAETVGQLIYDLGNKQWDIPKLRSLLENILPKKTSFDNYEVIHEFASIGRRVMLLNARQIKRVFGKERIILLAIEDITVRMNSEEILMKFNRTLRAISNTNQALMQEENEQTFLEKVCAIIVNDCGIKLAWVGFADNPADKAIRAVAKCGNDDGYLKALKPEWGIPDDNYPVGKAIRKGKIVVCNNMLTDPDLAPWRDEAIKHGFASLIALPLKSTHSVFGVLMMYSGEINAYPEAEVKLLEELAYDLSYGIMLIRVRNEKNNAEFEIKKIAAFPRLNPNPISEIDSTGRIYYINPAFIRLFPDPAEHNFNHPWFEGISAYFKALKGGKKKVITRDVKVQDRYFFQTIVFMPAESTIRIYGVDISKRIAAENELKHLNDLMETKVQERTTELLASKHLADIGTLAATVAHELRNPLGVINLASFNLRKKTKGKDMLKHIFNIEKKVAESGKIINDLLVYSKMKMPLFERTDIYSLLTDCGKTVKKHMDSRKIRLVISLAPVKRLLIGADAAQLREVFTNIITNAYQAIENKKGSVTVKAFLKPGNRIGISVKDTGLGINKEDMSNIFKPFFTHKTKGTGLGLVVSRDLVVMHGGTIDVVSKPGKGSTFTVTLPVRRS